MKDYKSELTGNRIVINPASFGESVRLKNVLFGELKSHSLGLKLIGNTNDLLNKEIDFTALLDFLKDVLIGVDISDDVNAALWACLKHCTYQTTYRIDADLFDKVPEAREDYYEIIFTCIEENLRPFIKCLVSKWKTLAPKIGESQALNVIFQQMNA